MKTPRVTVITRLFQIVLMLVLSMQTASALSASGPGVRVAGNQFFRDGAPFIVKGYIFESFLQPKARFAGCREEIYCQIRLAGQDFYYGRGQFAKEGALDLAKKWGANTIRLNINQGALDPQGPHFIPGYIGEVRAAVEFARARGFVVDLPLFDDRNYRAPQAFLEDNPKTPLDNAVTLGAAVALSHEFGKDRNVMLELLNEPWSPTGLDIGWRLWRDGGSPAQGKYANQPFVGVNQIISEMRENGSQNLIIVQGLAFTFQGFPGGVSDPLGQIAYSVHPFFLDGRPAYMDWNTSFGDLAAVHPVVLTAWGTLPGEAWCEKWGPSKPLQLMDYLTAHHIGVIAYALDIPFTVIRDFRKDPTVLTHYSEACGGGPGALIDRHFHNKDGAGPAQ